MKSTVRSFNENRLFVFNAGNLLSRFVLLTVLFFSCEKVSLDSGCWRCTIKTTIELYDEPHKREIFDYYDACDTTFRPAIFESMNTWDWDTINGYRMKRETSCLPLECW